jgi:uncharacterized protein YyaL (SSP411 family)
VEVDPRCIGLALKYFTQRFDPVCGGFGSEPKFPTPVNLWFLLQLVQLRPEMLSSEDVLAAEQMSINTLQKMTFGGIHGTSLWEARG